MTARAKVRRATRRAKEYSKDDRHRLAFISWQIGEKKQIDDAHLQWLNDEILVAVLSGADLRPRFAEGKSGRPVDRNTVHSAIDFRMRLERDPTLNREDLAQQVAEDWGYEDGATVLKYERRSRRMCDLIVYNNQLEPSQRKAWEEILLHGRSTKSKGRKSK